MKRDCLTRKKDLRDDKPSVVGVAKGSNLFNRGGMFLAIAESLGKSDWILDSGHLFHKCSVREHFDTYQPCKKGNVKMVNGAQSRVGKVEIVRIRMFDGVVRTETGVRHMLDLKRNLFFFWDTGFKRLPIFISRWNFECIQRHYGGLERGNV